MIRNLYLTLVFLAYFYRFPVDARSVADSTQTVMLQTEYGVIQVVLFMKQAPVTCANFLYYVHLTGEKGGTFYRTVTPENQPDNSIKIEVIQGGFNLEGVDSTCIHPIVLERTSITGLSHVNGTLSMARSDPDTGSTEFFICIGDQPSLDYGGMRNPDGQGFAAFGRVTSGMEVVRLIQLLPAEGQMLNPPVIIFSVRIDAH
jgi:peptidyl-prolyl cis-trans isomerase A (cyclophilin A)